MYKKLIKKKNPYKGKYLLKFAESRLYFSGNRKELVMITRKGTVKGFQKGPYKATIKL